MINLNSDFYDTLAQELITQIVDNEQDEGVVEIDIDGFSQALFLFYNVDYTLSQGIGSMGYLMLAFERGIRVSTDFCPERLDEKITL
ncbi:MAG: hypothetical protein RR980_03820 [Mucinivorans sp.]